MPYDREERQSEVISALREGTDALKALHEDMGDVAALMDETQDQLEMGRRFAALLSGETTDDSDLLAELDAMAAPVLDLPAAPSCCRRRPIGLPAAPFISAGRRRGGRRAAVPA